MNHRESIPPTLERMSPASESDSGRSSRSAAPCRPLRLLFAANVARDRLTGTGSVFLSLAGALARRGHDVEMLLKEDFPAAEKSGRLSRIVFPYLLAREIRARIQANKKYDVVMIHEPSGMAYALAKKWNSNLPPLVAMSQGIEQRAWELNAERTRRSVKRRILYPLTELLQANHTIAHADAVACVAGEDAEYVSRRWGAVPARTRVLSNGVDDEFLNRTWVPGESPGLLFVGTWILRKGSREMVKLFVALKEKFPSLGLTILGSSVPAQAVLNDFPSELQGALTVIPRVERDAMPFLLARDQVFVLPSYFEGMPLSLLEAMAVGLPCVTTNTCGMRDLISHGKNGLMVSPGDVDGLISSVSSLLSSSATRRRLGDAARETARRRTWDAVSADWEALFLQTAQAATP